jgi:hypothetical protein
MSRRRGLTPYLLLGVLGLATGVGAALGVSQAPGTASAQVVNVPCAIFAGTTHAGVLCSPGTETFTYPLRPTEGFIACLTEGVPQVDTSSADAYQKGMRAVLSRCERHEHHDGHGRHQLP